MKIGTSGLSAILLVVAASARTDAQIAITEDEFLQAIGDSAPAVVALGAELAAAESQRRRAGLPLNPRVELAREHPSDNPRQDTWTVAWTPPFLDARYSLTRRAADKGVIAAREALVLERMRLREGARKAFADWVLAGERGSLLASEVDRIDQLTTYMSARAQLGEESGLAAGRLRLATVQRRADAAIAAVDRTRAEAVIRTWRPDLTEAAKPVRARLPEPPDIGAVASPEINALAAESEKATLERRLAGRFWGFPELQVGRQKIDHGANATSGPVFGVSWTVPLFDRGQPERALAHRRLEIAGARLEIAKRRIAAELAAAAANYKTLREAARRIREETAASPRLREAAIASFHAGETGVTDLLDTLRSVLDAQLREMELYAAALDAHRSLELAVGRPLGGQQ